MLAIPFFVMAGEFMSVGGLTDKLVNLAYAFVGHVRGSLGHVTTLSSMLFASMSGSSTAAVASIGGMLLPAMKKKYSPRRLLKTGPQRPKQDSRPRNR